MKYVQRLATKEEISRIIDLIIQKEWEGVLRFPYSPFGVKGLAEGEQSFFARLFNEHTEAIGEYVVVLDFVEIDFCVYSLLHSLIDNIDRNSCYIFSQRIMKIGNVFEILQDDETAFDISQEVQKSSAKRKIQELSAGRPQKPTDESIHQAHQVIDLIDHKQDTPINVTDACKQVGIPRNTYYRAAKWITENVPVYQNTKIK